MITIEKELHDKAHAFVMNHYNFPDTQTEGCVQLMLEENAYMAGYKQALLDVTEYFKEP